MIAQRAVEGMDGHERVERAEGIAAMARPPVIDRSRDESCPNGIRLDVPTTVEEVSITVDHGRSEAALPKRSGTFEAIVEIPNVATPQRLHHATRRVCFRRREQEVYVVRHEDVRVYRASRPLTYVTEQVRVPRSILVAGKARSTIVSTLDEMEGLSGANDSGRSWHAGLMAPCCREGRIGLLRSASISKRGLTSI